VEGQAPGSSSGEAGGQGSFTKPDEMGSFSLLIGGWATATAGGLFLFLFLAPRRRQPEPVLAEAGAEEFITTDTPPAPPAPAPEAEAEQVLPEEANMPRWLRPSVQAARRGQRGSRSGTGRLEDS
jgi:hypothetical protein